MSTGETTVHRTNQTNQTKPKTYQIALVGVMAAILCVIGPFAIPIGPVSITLATFGIILSGYVLGPKLGTLAVLVYLLLGAVGLPVFSGAIGGLSKFVGPTGGYLIGWLALSFLTGLFVVKFKGKIAFHVLGAVLGSLVLYVIGTVWFIVVTGFTLEYALAVCVLPFLVGDAIKIIAAIAVGFALKRKLKFLS